MGGTAPYALADVLSDALRRLERSLASRRVRLVRQVDRTTPPINADPGIVRRIVDALLAEAGAATVEGGRVRVCLKHSRAAIMLSIKDQSDAPPAGEIEARIADAARAAAPGAPMNLAEVREAVAGLGGNFFANGAERKGITYYVTLPPRWIAADGAAPSPGAD